MDLLTDLLSRIRLASPLLSELRMGNDVSLGLGGGGAHSPFHYVVAGECRIVVGAETITLSAGSLALLPRWPNYRMETGRNHTRLEILDVVADHGLPVWSAERGVDQPLLLEVGPGPCTCRILSGIVSLEQPELALLGRVLPEILVIDGAATTLGPWVDAAVDFIAAETSPASAGFTVAAARIVELLFVIAIRSWVLNHNPGEFWLRDIADSKISKAIFAMQDDLSQKWTLSKLAKIAGQSRSSFAEQFRQVMGETPMRYLVKLRMHAAEHDLASGHSSVAEIAHLRGYQSSYAFTRAFRTIHGVTPAQFRRRASGCEGAIETV